MQKQQQLLCILISILLMQFGNCQTSTADDKTYGGIDVGINMTSVISSFSGNGNLIDASDFPLVFRFGKKKLNLRLGLGVQASSQETFDNITFAFRESSFREVSLRFGFERHIESETKLNGYWGLDFIGRFDQDQVEIFGNNGGMSVLKDNTIGVGGGPLFGLKYQLSSRIYFSSEATLYGLLNFETYTEEGLNTNTRVNTTSYDLSLQAPLMLYINYKL